MDTNKDINKKNTIKEVPFWQPAMIMFLKLSVWIAAPIIIALYLGEWLDQKFATKPWLFLSCISLAFVVSLTGLIKNTFQELEKLDNNSKNKSDGNSPEQLNHGGK
ncbi:MAG: AtpZ/AtpI family protein [Patescibacteria group bacterium]